MPIRLFILCFLLTPLASCASPKEGDCDFWGNCKCKDWYSTCSAHD